MIKNFAKRKFVITTFAFLIFFITLIFPSTKNEDFSKTTTYLQGKTMPIYLLDSNHYVARTKVVSKEDNTLSIIQELLDFLTIKGNSSAYLPNIFDPVIPHNTKVISLDIQDKVLKINFSKEFLNIPKEYEEQLIECLVYTLTELEEVDKVMIFVEGNILNELPNSHKVLPHVLTRDIGVNVTYQFSMPRDVLKTTTYYLAKEENITYYIPITVFENSDKDKVEIIIERLKSNPHLQTNLISYLNASAELTNYELLEQEIKLSFNDALFEGLTNDEIKEEAQYLITLSMKDTFNVEKVTFIN